MIVVIEGPDGAGKTTLAHMIAQIGRRMDLRVTHTHKTEPSGSAYTDYCQAIQSGSRGDGLVIADRLHLGELVYGTTRRERPSYGFATLVALNQMIRNAPGHIFVLTPGYPVCHDRIRARGEQVPFNLAFEHDRFRFLGETMTASDPDITTHMDGKVSPVNFLKIANTVMSCLKVRECT